MTEALRVATLIAALALLAAALTAAGALIVTCIDRNRWDHE